MINKNNIYFNRLEYIKQKTKKNIINNTITYKDDNKIQTTVEFDKNKMSENLFKYMKTYIKNK